MGHTQLCSGLIPGFKLWQGSGGHMGCSGFEPLYSLSSPRSSPTPLPVWQSLPSVPVTKAPDPISEAHPCWCLTRWWVPVGSTRKHSWGGWSGGIPPALVTSRLFAEAGVSLMVPGSASRLHAGPMPLQISGSLGTSRGVPGGGDALCPLTWFPALGVSACPCHPAPIS